MKSSVKGPSSFPLYLPRVIAFNAISCPIEIESRKKELLSERRGSESSPIFPLDRIIDKISTNFKRDKENECLARFWMNWKRNVAFDVLHVSSVGFRSSRAIVIYPEGCGTSWHVKCIRKAVEKACS